MAVSQHPVNLNLRFRLVIDQLYLPSVQDLGDVANCREVSLDDAVDLAPSVWRSMLLFARCHVLDFLPPKPSSFTHVNHPRAQGPSQCFALLDRRRRANLENVLVGFCR